MPDILAEKDGSVLRVTINRPERRNALSRATLAEIRAAFEAHEGDASLRLAFLRGAGDRCFAAGGDLKDLARVRTEEAAAAMAEDAKRALGAIRRFPLPVVALVNGDALGGGAELACACDLRVAAAHARIGFVQGRLNISTAWGGGVDLMRIVGSARALRLLARSELVDAARAKTLGLVDEVAEAGSDVEAAAAVFVAPMLAQAPQVLRAFKELAATAAAAGRGALDELETRRFAACWAHDDHWRAADALLQGSR